MLRQQKQNKVPVRTCMQPDCFNPLQQNINDINIAIG